MTTNPPPPSSDETPEELDEFLARRVQRVLATPPIVDDDLRRQHLAAAMSAFDELQVDTDRSARDHDAEAAPGSEPSAGTVMPFGTSRRGPRSWLALASAAAVVVVVGVGVVASTSRSQHDDATVASEAYSTTDESDSLRAGPERSEDDALDTTAEQASEPELAPIEDLGAFDSLDAAGGAARAAAGALAQGTDVAGDELAGGSVSPVNPTAADPAAQPSEQTEDTFLSSPACDDGATTTWTGEATVDGVRYRIEFDAQTNTVVAIDLATCTRIEI